ncbi:PhzF family phenazine biosynthesis protein [Clostridium sp. MD294]|uniref:PhzF family phenazine biosynthesis protein n=1 Tax=Clostridium sp. MD294 TaxID=97138 RepID=UPI0005583955|nr:PhzF family phenazine biosynthesis protein [Clostridium sp. MD294]NDO45556.1 PhzF family phenazine biosynthesis protein [Clostridium sp. MD294]
MKQYIIDAFTDKVFTGNPAAICIMEKFPSEDIMIKMAIENNLSETAFAVKKGEKYHLRWFTPGGEIDLCGHATLACGYVIMNFYDKETETVVFTTLSGDLSVHKKGELYEMDFPAYDLKKVEITNEMIQAIGVTPTEAYLARDLLCIFDSAEIVKNLQPDMEKVKRLEGLLLQVTAKGENTDCISRSFAPKLNVVEDPVCGSGHCHIVPYWSKKLQKEDIVAYQASKRGGTLYCKVVGDRIKMSGKAVLYSIAEINI